MIIDGTSEPNFVNMPVIQIDGTALSAVGGNNYDALRLTANSDGSTIRGLSITNFSDSGIWGDAIDIRSDHNTIVGNYLGIAPDGTTVAGNETGITLRNGADFNTIGGMTAADRNIISGNSYSGVSIIDNNTNDNRIIGNWIGLDKNGDVVVAGDHGVVIWDGPYNNQVGGVSTGEGNRIAGHNNGVNVDDNGVASLNNAILGNEIFSVNEMAIDLDNDQITTNDAGDVDSGPNDLLNHPVLTDVTQNGGDLDITFDLDVPAGNYRIEFFENPAGIGGLGLGEGQVFLGAVTVTHAGSGVQSFSETLGGVMATAIGSVTATATEDLSGGRYGSTSEFCGPGPVNDEQVLAVNTGTTVDEGSIDNIITTAMLETTDVDNTTIDLVYTITAVPVYGTLYLNTTALGVSDTFTQDDIDNNRVSYDHNGSENFTDGFGFDVDDGAGAVTSATFDITITPVNDAPTTSAGDTGGDRRGQRCAADHPGRAAGQCHRCRRDSLTATGLVISTGCGALGRQRRRHLDLHAGAERRHLSQLQLHDHRRHRHGGRQRDAGHHAGQRCADHQPGHAGGDRRGQRRAADHPGRAAGQCQRRRRRQPDRHRPGDQHRFRHAGRQRRRHLDLTPRR